VCVFLSVCLSRLRGDREDGSIDTHEHTCMCLSISSMFVCSCVSIYLSLYFSISPLSSASTPPTLTWCTVSVELFVYLSIHLSIYVCIYLSIYLSIHLSIDLQLLPVAMYLFIYVYINLSIYRSIYVRSCVSIHLSIYLSISSLSLSAIPPTLTTRRFCHECYNVVLCGAV